MAGRPTPHRSPLPASRSAARTKAALAAGRGLLSVSFLISLALHGLLLLVGFAMPERTPPRERDRGLEVVLVNARHARAPEKAEVLAQSNVDAGGNVDREVRAKTPLPPQQARQEGNALTDARKRTAARESPRAEVLTAPKSPARTQAALEHPDPAAAEPLPSGIDLLNSVAAVARLEAEIDRQLEEYAKRPRKKFIGARAKEYGFAQYLEDWREKVQRVGNLNYPEAARGKIYGSLLLFVAIKSDGTLVKAEVQRSSGQKVLDEAALRIVTLAAPYAEFPDDLKQKVDIIEFARTWTFTNEGSLTAK